MRRRWVPIGGRGRSDRRRVGGKGASLLLLARAGFAVPPGFVLTTDFTRDYRVRPDRAWLETFLARLMARYDPEGTARWAVRSSSVQEDSAQASFAGQLETFLDLVGPGAVAEAVEACLAALHAAPVEAYRTRIEVGTADELAIVVQRLVSARRAGVLFTRHPFRPDLDECVVEAVAGLGEALVSGRVDPDRLALDRLTGQRLEATRANSEGEHAAAFRPDAAWLADAERLEQACGGPQDAEWAWDGKRLWWLQARPITTLPQPREAWSREWGDEFWAEAVTPLQVDLLGRWIREEYFASVARIMGWRELEGMEPIVVHRHHIYVNAGYIDRLVERIPPGLRVPQAFRWLPPAWRARLPHRPYRRWSGSMSWLRARWIDPEANPLTHHRHLEAYLERIEAELRPRLDLDLRLLDDAALRRHLEEGLAFGAQHFRFIRWGLGSFLFPLKLMVLAIGRAWADDPYCQRSERLLRDPGTATRTARVARELGELARVAAAEPWVRTYLIEHPEPSWVRLRSVPEAAGFVTACERFLERHGHRGTSRELIAPRWRERPELVLALVAARLRAAPMGFQQEVDGSLVADEAAWFAAIRRGPWGRLRAALARRVLELARAYLRYREDQRYGLDFILFDLRRTLLELARRLHAGGRLQEPELIFFLREEELWATLDGAHPPADLAERRRAYERDAADRPAPWIIDGKAYGDEVRADGDALTGTPVSPGCVRGPVRVVRRPEELRHVRQGEILVAPGTDPGWTPIFPLLAGLVLETGGMLSHGAILAREYGLPAVSGLVGATHLFRDGEFVEVDGDAGRVRRLVVGG